MAQQPQDPARVVAHTFRRAWGTASQPVLLACDDGREYVTKGSQVGRMVVNEHVVCRLGQCIEAPTPNVVIVDIPGPLIAAEPQMRHLNPGEAHGAEWIANCTERETLLHSTVAENRSRFALLALLYGWVVAADHQFIYGNDVPHLVFSVDHGHFFPGGPNWSEETLRSASSPRLDPVIAAACGFSKPELQIAAKELRAVVNDWIARIVEGPPEAWGLTPAERQTLREYLEGRRDELAAGLP